MTSREQMKQALRQVEDLADGLLYEAAHAERNADAAGRSNDALCDNLHALEDGLGDACALLASLAGAPPESTPVRARMSPDTQALVRAWYALLSDGRREPDWLRVEAGR